jgi:MoaA/NifB/PqqE/SkfB family radical SAM enzyme
VKTRDKLRIGLKVARARLTRKAQPFFVQYSLLSNCNAHCAYCNCPLRRDPQLTTAEHHEILADFARLGAVRIKFLGGEPLLRDDVGELVTAVRRLRMRAAMVTNGFLVPERFDVIRKLDELIISIDGNEAAHDRQRGRGTWQKVMRAIELCASEKLDFFLSAVVTRESADQIDWLLDLARRLGVQVNFQIVQHNPAMYGNDARNWLTEDTATRGILGRILAAKEAGAPVLFSSRSYQTTLAWPDYGVERFQRPGEISPCTAGRYFLQMEPNGDIYPCVLHIGTFTPKNAVRDGVEAAWRHAQNHSCFSCYNTWLNENRAIFDLKPAVLHNLWRNYLVSRPGRTQAERIRTGA